MRNVISILSFLFLCSLGTFANRSAEAAEAGGIVMQDKTSQSVDSERKSRASKRQAEMQQWKEDMTEFKNRQGKGELSSLADSIAFLQAHAAVSDSSFVLEADYLILRNGTRVMVNSGTTFISVDGDRARGRPVEPAQHVQQRRLARAGRADDGDELALRHGQVYPVERPDLRFARAVILFQRLGL